MIDLDTIFTLNNFFFSIKTILHRPKRKMRQKYYNLNFYFLNSINYIIKLNNLKIIYYYNVTSKILHIAIT